MLFFIKSAPCRLAPIEALPHTPLGALPCTHNGFHPLTLTRDVSLDLLLASLGALFYFMLAIYFGLLCSFLIPHSSFLIPHFTFLPSSLKIRPHILQFTSKCAIIISIGGLIHEKTLFRNFYELFRLRHDNFLGCSRDRPRLLFH